MRECSNNDPYARDPTADGGRERYSDRTHGDHETFPDYWAEELEGDQYQRAANL
ncbi:hypothetical protein [Candidatus Nanohalococcus occultus]|uniref:hypothetical protein n=1 Tax=Candidatus Nanohalococcus occultus TaxID=2978047 RepID=UPI0039E06409